MKTTITIKLTQAEACAQIKSILANNYKTSIDNISVIFEDNIAPVIPDVCNQPPFNIHTLSAHIRSNFTRETKIQAIKFLRDEAKDLNIYIPLSEAKFFIENIIGIR